MQTPPWLGAASLSRARRVASGRPQFGDTYVQAALALAFDQGMA